MSETWTPPEHYAHVSTQGSGRHYNGFCRCGWTGPTRGSMSVACQDRDAHLEETGAAAEVERR